jgi:hypothetical protein
MGIHAFVTTRAKTRTSTFLAPARSNVRAAALIVAPEVRTSSTNTMERPFTAPRAASETLKAPCTFIARSPRDNPTCDEVDFTRSRAKSSILTSEIREMLRAYASA